MAIYGSIEAGGTKFVCAVSDEELNILERVSFPTTVPEVTMTSVIDFFKQYQSLLNAHDAMIAHQNEFLQSEMDNNQTLMKNVKSILLKKAIEVILEKHF